MNVLLSLRGGGDGENCWPGSATVSAFHTERRGEREREKQRDFSVEAIRRWPLILSTGSDKTGQKQGRPTDATNHPVVHFPQTASTGCRTSIANANIECKKENLKATMLRQSASVIGVLVWVLLSVGR